MKEKLTVIFADYLENAEYLDTEQKMLLMYIIQMPQISCSFWYDCLQVMDNRLSIAEAEQLTFTGGKICQLTCKNDTLALDVPVFWALISKIIDCFEPVYPLGTVVELREDFSAQLGKNYKGKKLRVVIMDRLVTTADKRTYFPYVGTIYPFGQIGTGRFLHFTTALIDSVLQMGYSDSTENDYILYRKRQLLVDYEATSFGFLSAGEMKQYEKEFGGSDGKKTTD